MQAKPFLKWVGGKGQLLEQINNFLPEELASGAIARYIEPFVGGGAVYLHLAQLYKIEELIVFDINAELILAYKTIQSHVEELIKLLLEIKAKYFSLDEEERKKYFYQVRTQFNWQLPQIDFNNFNDGWIERTAQLIFLNRTCFNGLYRVNSKGEFNVPPGRYKNPTICDSQNLRAVSKVLKNTQIYCGDFAQCEQYVNKQTLVYFDPPYKPISKTANFTSYSQYSFNDAEQFRLRDFFQSLDRKGAKLILSNSDPKNIEINDNFFEDAYQGYRIERVKAKRSINSDSSQRDKINEILIMNY